MQCARHAAGNMGAKAGAPAALAGFENFWAEHPEWSEGRGCLRPELDPKWPGTGGASSFTMQHGDGDGNISLGGWDDCIHANTPRMTTPTQDTWSNGGREHPNNMMDKSPCNVVGGVW